MLLPLDSPAARQWLEAWNPDKHPRGFHGRFGVSVGEVRAENRANNVTRLSRNTRTPRSAGFTDQHWLTAYHAHRRPRGETLDQYKRRAIADALARGMTQDEHGFFYKSSDPQHRHPLSPSGFGVAVAPPRIEQHRMNRPHSDRAEAQVQAGMKPRRRKYRRARTAVLDKVGYRTVGTDTGQRRATKVKTAHEALFGYSPALARLREAAAISHTFDNGICRTCGY